MTFEHEIPGDDFARAGEASSYVKNKLKQLGFSPEVVRKVSIAAYEGEINAIIHGGGGVMKVTVESDGVTVVISDAGKGIPDIEKAMSEGFTTASDKVRELGFGAGMGLPNMKKYSDEFDIQSEVGKGTTITMKAYNR